MFLGWGSMSMSRSSMASDMTAVSSGDGRFSSLWKTSVHLSCSFFALSSMFVLIRPSCAFSISTTNSFCCHVYSPLLFAYCHLFYLSRKLVYGFSLVTACKFLYSPFGLTIQFLLSLLQWLGFSLQHRFLDLSFLFDNNQNLLLDPVFVGVPLLMA